MRFLSIPRLACRNWNMLPQPRLLHTLTLTHDHEFSAWNTALGNEAAKHAAESVTIHSAPDDLYNDRDYDTWSSWRGGYYPEFTNAISRIKELPSIAALELKFSDKCQGREGDQCGDDAEIISTRLNTLNAVFKAIRSRAEENPNYTAIRSLSIENIQNLPIPDFTSSDLFKTVMKDIRGLHLQVAEEYNEHGPDRDVECIERVQFEPYLQQQWLAPIAHQLTSLSLSFNECWGTAPGYFSGAGLIFPQLKTLNLGNFVASHHDHFDWILAQESLTSLGLDRCYIASHLRLCESQLETWKPPTHDWKQHPTGSFGFDWEDDCTYTFSGTWETIFDNIRSRLTNLSDFRFSYSTESFCSTPALIGLHNRRYITLDTGLLPTPWIEASGHDGEMKFGNNDSTVWQPKKGENSYRKRCGLNKAKGNEKGDLRALDELLQVVGERRRDKSLSDQDTSETDGEIG